MDTVKQASSALLEQPIANNRRNGRRPKEQAVDSGWAWVALAASFIIQVLLAGSGIGTSIYFTEFLADFQQGPVLTSWLVASSYAFISLADPIGSICANKFGFRLVIIMGSLIASTGFILSCFAKNFWLLFISFGFITPVGFALVYAPAFGILALYFDKRKNVATAFVTVGGGLGAFIFPPLHRLMVNTYTWRGSLFLMAAITAHIIPCALLFSRHIKPPEKKASLAASADVSLFRKASFYLLLLHFFLMAGDDIFVIQSVRFATSVRGISADLAPAILSSLGLVDSVGRLLAVAISANPWTGRKTVRFWIVHLTTAATGLSILFFAWSHTLVLLCAWGGLNGLFLGLRWSLFPGLQIDLFGAKRFSTSWSYGSTLMGMGSLLLPPFGETLAQYSQNPLMPFYAASTFVMGAAACTLVLHLFPPSFNTREELPVEEKPEAVSIIA